MDKKNQIEEMARDFGNPTYCCFADTKSCKECILEGDCIPRKYAEAAYNAGYCKIPEGSVVLTKEEKQKLLHEMYEQGKFDGVVKIAERLKKDCVWRNDFDTEGVAHPYTILELEDLDEICKEIIGDEK